MNDNSIRIHPTAEISDGVTIGENSSIWHYAQIRESAVIGKNCIIGKGVYIDHGVLIGNNVKIQNNVSIYNGVIIEDGVFIGPHVCFTNDLYPRAVNPDYTLKKGDDWQITKTTIKSGTSIGANSTIRCGITIEKWSLIGVGSVVTKDIPPFSLAFGNPAKLVGHVCYCGEKIGGDSLIKGSSKLKCAKCSKEIEL